LIQLKCDNGDRWCQMVTEQRKEQMRQYWYNNKHIYNKKRMEKYYADLEYRKQIAKWKHDNPEKIKIYGAKWWEKNRLKYLEIYRQRSKEWYAAQNKEEYRNHKRIWERNKKNNDIQYAIKKRLRLRVWQAVNGIRKETYDSEFHIDYKPIINKLLAELPNDFKENRSKYQIDHIIALHNFNLANQEELEKAFAPNNHQWLTLEEHQIKTNKEIKNK